MRLDAYLAKKHPEHSRATWAKYIKSGFVTVNNAKPTGSHAPLLKQGAGQADPSDSVNDGDDIVINLPDLEVEEIDLPVIYEDDNVIVINKPAGVLTHSKGALNDEFTVSDFIKKHVANDCDREKGKRAERPGLASAKLGFANRSMRKTAGLSHGSRFGIVHRLDRGTSGVIIGAKNDEALKKLQRQFSDRKAKKKYLAIVEKAPKSKEFRIDLPILRNPKHPSQFKVDSKGKPAITNVKVLEKYKDGRALLELSPETGRTHQLRVHLAYVGSPIVGDVVYGNEKNGDRMMLHAKELEITLPDGERRVFIAKTPDEFADSRKKSNGTK